MAKLVNAKWEGAMIALICGSLILFLSFGIRHTFGLFLQPVTMSQEWGRETFAFAIALQNLIWGISQPFTGMLSDRFGAKPILVVGAILYGTGLWVMSSFSGEYLFTFGAGVLIGLGLSGTTFPVIFGAISRLVRPAQRSLAMGITMSVASFGQFAMLPIALGFLTGLDWQSGLIFFSLLVLAIIPLSVGIKPEPVAQSRDPEKATFRQSLRDACTTRDFWLLSLGFFTCGFQVVFIAVHLPAFLSDEGLGSGISSSVLALIGLVNIAGTYLAGLWGGIYRKPMILTIIYLSRAVIISVFVLSPITQTSAYIFGALMGLLWLSTIPLTNGTVASIWGVRHMSMLGGVVFLAHQLGSFVGGWMGGWLYDYTGNYSSAWSVAIILSILAAMFNWPITERAFSERSST